MNPDKRYYNLSTWIRSHFGEPARKITVDAGLGCPNRDATLGQGGCIYCNERGSGTGAASRTLNVLEQIDRSIQRLRVKFRCKKYIVYFQSFTNTYGTVEHLESIYSQAFIRAAVVGLAIGTRPDCIDEEKLTMINTIREDRTVWLEYGIQSIHEKTLKLIKRRHTAEDFFKAIRLTKKHGLPAVAHLILGLPGETTADMIDSAKAIADAGVFGIKLHPLYVVKNTALAQMYRSGDYKPLEEDQATELTLKVLSVLPDSIVIHRLTSDPHLSELIAPQWMLDRKGVRERLNKAMEDANCWQGCARSQ